MRGDVLDVWGGTVVKRAYTRSQIVTLLLLDKYGYAVGAPGGRYMPRLEEAGGVARAAGRYVLTDAGRAAIAGLVLVEGASRGETAFE